MLTSNATDLVRKDSIEELCGHRARALQLYQQAVDTLRAAQSAHRMACAGKGYVTTEFLRDVHRVSTWDAEMGEMARRAVDLDMWRYFIIGTPLGSLMDAQEKKEFERSLEKDAPEVTPDTVFATMARLAGDAGVILRRGLVNAFQGFSPDFRSHDGFKIGDRFVVRYLITGQGRYRYLNHYIEDRLHDIDRCMHVLDGKPAPDHQQGIRAAIRTGLASQATEATSDYFRVRWFKNGNAHFYPLRADLVRQANKLIAEHFGEAIGAGPDARGRN